MALQLPKPIYEKKGDVAMLLLHAYSGSSNDVRMLARFFERKNFSVYAPIFSGHGTLRPEDILESSPEKWEQEAKNHLQFLKDEGFEKIFVFGLSMGGIFATILLEHNDPALLGGGVFSSPIYPLKESNVPENFLLYAKEVLKVAQVPEEESQLRLAAIEKKAPEQLEAIQTYSDKAYQQLNQMNVPYFIGQAGLDEMIPAGDILQAVEVLAKENKNFTFRWYDKSSHVLTVGKQRKHLEGDVWHFVHSVNPK